MQRHRLVGDCEDIARRCQLAGLVLLVGCAVHVGRPAHPDVGYSIAAVDAPVAEPGVADALRQSVGHALAVRGALGGDHGLRVTVLEASTTPLAATGAQRVSRANLRVRVFDTGEGLRSIEVQRSVDFIEADAGAELGAARASAFERAAALVGEDVAIWLIGAPT